MSELTDKITISESNLSNATKKDYDFRLGLFYRISPVKSDDELIDCPTDELQKILVSYTRHLLKRVNNDDLSANTIPKMVLSEEENIFLKPKVIEVQVIL